MEIVLFIYLIFIILLAFNITRIFYQRMTLFSTPNDFSFCDKVVYEAYNIFIDWPNSFHKFLDKFQTLPQKRAVGGLKNYFDGFHLQKSKLSQVPEFRFLTDEANYIQNFNKINIDIAKHKGCFFRTYLTGHALGLGHFKCSPAHSGNHWMKLVLIALRLLHHQK